MELHATDCYHDGAWCSGAQVGVASFVVNYLQDQNIGINASKASQLFSFCQITFTVGRWVALHYPRIHHPQYDSGNFYFYRFVGVVILNFVDPALLLSFYGIACSAFCLCVSQLEGKAGVGCLFALFFFESICYPVMRYVSACARDASDCPV